MQPTKRFTTESNKPSGPSPNDGKETEAEMVWERLRTSGMTKNVLQGTVRGTRRRGRLRKRWEDNIKEAWTSQTHKGRQTTGRSIDSWFQDHRWCPNYTTRYGIDDGDDDDDEYLQSEQREVCSSQ